VRFPDGPNEGPPQRPRGEGAARSEKRFRCSGHARGRARTGPEARNGGPRKPPKVFPRRKCWSAKCRSKDDGMRPVEAAADGLESWWAGKKGPCKRGPHKSWPLEARVERSVEARKARADGSATVKGRAPAAAPEGLTQERFGGPEGLAPIRNILEIANGSRPRRACAGKGLEASEA